MKKSTLITTIAMIVVVVVALSTATYAWFSSSTQTVVQTEITTTAAAGWLLYGGTLSNTTVTYSSATALNMTLMSGLYSPEALINTSLQYKTMSTELQNPASFYSALVKGTEYQSEAGASAGAANFIRVVNSASAPKVLKIRIIVYLDTGSDAEFRAGSAFSTYIYSTNALSGEGNEGTPTIAKTAYNYGDCTNTTTGTGSGYYLAQKDGTETKGNVTYSSNNISAASDIPSTGWSTAGENYVNGDFTLAKGTKFYTIESTFQQVPANGAVNMMFYAWLDGWQLDDTARGATVKVAYEFGDTFNSITTA